MSIIVDGVQSIARDIALAARSILPPKSYKEVQQDLRAKQKLWADSRVIRKEGLQLRRLEKGKTVFEKRHELPGVLGADGKRQHIRERIDASVKRAVALGLGKLRRLT
jgi:hypothetical protein